MRKWIGYYQNIISNDLCDKLIDYSDNQKPLQPSTYSTSSGKSDRSNERVKMDDGEVAEYSSDQLKLAPDFGPEHGAVDDDEYEKLFKYK